MKVNSQNEQNHKYKILLVDDEDGVVYVLCEGLKLQGFQVDGFSSSVQALGAFRPGTYDLAILDIRMPGLTGIQLYRELRQREPMIIPAFLSAFEIYANEFEKVFPSIGSQVRKTIITKPATIDGLVKEIRPLLQYSAIARATTGDHIIAVFDSQEQLIEQSLSFLKIGFEKNNEDILLVIDQASTTIHAIRQKIDTEWNVNENDDVASLESDGRITLMTFDEWHLTDGKFDIERNKARFAKMAKRSKEKGRSGIRLAADMNSFITRRIFQQLAAWEASLGKRFDNMPITAMCAYTKDILLLQFGDAAANADKIEVLEKSHNRVI